jgi:hypothetical protein
LGSNSAIMERKIFQQRQIARAVELGLGASSASEIDLVPVDTDSKEYCDQVSTALHRG